MRFANYEDIMRAYSDKVAEYVSLGFEIFPMTMGGSQGEIAHVDFITPSHMTVCRVLLEQDGSYGDGSDHKIIIKVIAQTAQDLQCGSLDTLYTKDCWVNLWNNRGEVVYEQIWYGMSHGRDRRYSYTTDASVPAQAKAKQHYKWKNHLYAKDDWDSNKSIVTINPAKLVKFVRAHGGRGYGNTKVEDIVTVVKVKVDSRVRYLVKFTEKKPLQF